MQTVGAYLKKERTERSISLREISELTKISPWHIACLEKDEYDRLPQGPYVKGYLTSYAQILKINVAEVINRYQLQGCEPAHDSTPPMKDTGVQKRGSFTSSRNLRPFFAGVALIMIVAASWMFFWREEAPVPLALRPKPMIANSPEAIAALPPHVIPPPSTARLENAQGNPATFLLESPSSETPQAVYLENRPVMELALLRDEAMNSSPDTGAEASNEIEILQAIACTGIVNRLPVGPGKIFPIATPRVYIFNKLKYPQPPGMIRHVYYFNNRKTGETNLNIHAAEWRTWSYKTISNEHMVGEWRVDILSANGDVLTQVPFTIK